MYANSEVLKYIAAFHFQDPMLVEVIPALQKRILVIADVFPFFNAQQANIVFLRQEHQSIHLMRRLLSAMVGILEYNKTHPEPIAMDHTASTILYQAYEACLKNWYQEEYDPAVEQRFRQKLMDELLFDNNWTFLDVEQNIDSPWIMVDRDEQGFISVPLALYLM